MAISLVARKECTSFVPPVQGAKTPERDPVKWTPGLQEMLLN
jgi:hypothetical protein